jgi:hypothetical protein
MSDHVVTVEGSRIERFGARAGCRARGRASSGGRLLSMADARHTADLDPLLG